jgi:aromatic amino acid aminotransferase II
MTHPSLTSHLSKRSQNRPSHHFGGQPLPQHIKNKHYKDVLSFAGGRPYHGFFPVESIALGVLDSPSSNKGIQVNISRDHSTDPIKVLKNSQVNSSSRAIDIKDGFQYGPNNGDPKLLDLLTDFTQKVNPPGFPEWNITLSNGTGDSLHKVFNLLINPDDIVLVENYTYVPVLNNIETYGGRAFPIELNFEAGGIDLVKLRKLLANWDENEATKSLNKPKALYTIATGQNPTGLSLSNESRKELVEIAKEFDFIIVEDDPYGYIQLGSKEDEFKGITTDEYIKKLPNSLIQYDSEGRVLRLESFSKVFAPGSRLGFIVGSNEFISRIVKHTLVSTRAPSGISQTVISNAIEGLGELYDQGEGPDRAINGWLNWLTRLSDSYTERKLILTNFLEGTESYKKGYFKIVEPKAGMFLIITLNLTESDDYRDEIEQFRYKTVEHGLSVILGKNLAFEEIASKKATFVRLTIAAAEHSEELVQAGKRLDDAILEYFESK